jgi:hypothetical protein
MTPEPVDRPAERRRLGFAAAVYVLLALAIFRPTPARLAGDVVFQAGDPLFNVCVISWVANSAREGFTDLWSPPYYFPVSGVLALSDHLLGPGILAAALPDSVPRGLIVYNALILLSFPLGATFTFFVLRRSGLPPLAAFFGGLVFAFGPYRWSRLSHGQVLLAHWIPLLLWLWDRLLAEPRAKVAIAFTAVYALHVTGGTYLAYMAHVPLVVIWLVRFRHHGLELFSRARLRVLAPTLATCAALALVVFLPYLQISRHLGLVRVEGETLRWAGTLSSFLTPPWNMVYSGEWLWAFHRPENELFAGFLATALAALGLTVMAGSATATDRRGWQRAALAGAVATALAGLLLADYHLLGRAETISIGSWSVALHGFKGPGWVFLAGAVAFFLLRRNWRPAEGTWWDRLSTWERGLLLSAGTCALLTLPVVFLPVREILPGLSGMRVPSRFYPFVSLGIAYLAARGVAALTARGGRNRRFAVAALLAALIAVDVVPARVGWGELPDRRREAPVTHRWLAENAAEVGAYLELPIADDSTEILGMYLQTAHRVPMVNGYSGYFPRRSLELRRCCTSPKMGSAGIAELSEAGVTHLVVSRWKMKQPGLERREWRQFGTWLQRNGMAVRRWSDSSSSVFELVPPERWPPRARQAEFTPAGRRQRAPGEPPQSLPARPAKPGA